jgi:hypothetical protein
VRMRAAGLAIPYEVPKLAVTAMVTENDIATLLDRRIKRYEEMKLIEAKPNKVIEATPTNGEKVDARLRPPVPDRRYRRI